MTDTLTQNILEQILLYARRDKNNVNFDMHKAELSRFFGMIILSGYHNLPSERDYWSNQLDLGLPIVSEALSSKRFLQIKSMFHLVDNTTLEGNSNKMAKVMLLYDHLNSSFIKYGIFHKLLSIDESTVPYYVRHSYKMFIHSSPIQFGYKLCICGADGHPYHMTISTGRAENSTGPLCSRAVNEKLDVILQNSQNICWCIYRGSPSENKFYIFTNILVKSTHFWLLLIAFIKLVKL